MLLPFLSYVFVTTFTPGPNNVSSASMGMNYGYWGSFPFLFGIFCGFVGVMSAAGLLTEAAFTLIPSVEIILRFFGAIYMLYLAVVILRSSGALGNVGNTVKSATFIRGVLLQLINIKVIIYGITVYSGFILPHFDGFAVMFGAALFLACVAFVSISLWSITGAVLRRFFALQWFRLGFNIVMAVLLCYSALSLVVNISQ